jgi:hypothetical protein
VRTRKIPISEKKKYFKQEKWQKSWADGWVGGRMDGWRRRRYTVFIPICGEAGNTKEETVND